MQNSTENVFTIDPGSTKNFDNAFSLRSCSEVSHGKGCQLIGVHVTAAAIPKKVAPARIPCYYYKPSTFMDHQQKMETNMRKGERRRCISFYGHSNRPREDAYGPKLVDVKVWRNFTFEDYGIEDNDPLWNFFVVWDMKSKVLDDLTWRYFARHPNSYRILALIDKTSEFYRSAVAGYLRRLKQPVPLIVRPKWAYVPIDVEGPMIAKQDVYKKLEDTLQDDAEYEENACLFVASVKHLNETSPDHDKTVKFARLIVNTNALDVSTFILCTSPQTKLHHYVLQQILFRAMSGVEDDLLYSEADLQGIVTIRYNTPRVTWASVENIQGPHFTVYLEELQNTGKDLSRINFKKMGAEIIGGSTDQPTFVWKKDYLDGIPYEKNVVTIDREAYTEFYESFRDEDVERMQDAFGRLKCETREPATTYDRANSKIRLTVQRGTSLQMQISLDPSEIKEGLGHRMLLVGPQCHICLTHLRSPEMTFRTDRQDLKSFLKEPECYKNGGVEVKVNIEWYGGYNAGGKFVADKEVKECDLLCIRKFVADKEVKERKEKKDYVWCAHGVVTKVSKEPAKWHVEFAVLTLMQVDEKKRQEEFIVEIIELREAAPAADDNNA